MTYLFLGLALFFAAHSLRIAHGVRQSLVDRMGENPYKAVYSVISLIGLTLISYGFASYRASGLIPVWYPPHGMSHLALLLNWFAVVFFAAAYLPCHMRRVLKHPMLAGIKIWATAHLLANGDLGGIILFGAFLVWAIVTRINIKRRPNGTQPTKASLPFDFLALAIGSASYAAIVYWVHPDVFNIPVWPF